MTDHPTLFRVTPDGEAALVPTRETAQTILDLLDARPDIHGDLMTPITLGLCNRLQRYASGRNSARLCTLPESHESTVHTNGRVRWNEKTRVMPNRRDRRSAARKAV